MNRYLPAIKNSSPSHKQSPGRQRRLSFFLWIRDCAIKSFHKRAGLSLAAASVVPVASQAATFTVDTLSDNDNAGFTLREAITQANASAGADSITFNPALSGLLTLTQGELAITSELSITGPGSSLLIISGDADSSGDANSGDSRIFNITAGPVSISDLTLTNAYSESIIPFPNGDQNNGGAIRMQPLANSQLSLTNCTIANSSSRTGGGLYCENTELTLTNCTFSNNAGGIQGGGLASLNSDLMITNSNFTGANSTFSGAGLNCENGVLTMTNCTISANQGSNSAGLSLNGTDLSLQNCFILDNYSSNGTGGLACNNGVINITNSTISGNTGLGIGGISLNSQATIDGSTISNNTSNSGTGGGIDFNGTSLVISNSTFEGNSTQSSGGAIYLLSGYLTLDNCQLLNNTSAFSGGAIASLAGGAYGAYYTDITINDCTISNNTALNGGAIYTNGYDRSYLAVTLNINNTTFSSNSAMDDPNRLSSRSYAGGLELFATNANLNNCTIFGNTTEGIGGGLNIAISSTSISNCTIVGNSADLSGGGIVINDSMNGADNDLTISNTIIANNTAPSQPDLDFMNPDTTASVVTYSGVNLFGTPGLGDSQDLIETDPANIFAATSTINGILTGTLADNGGPAETVLILTGGRAQNTGLDSALPLDTPDLDNDGNTTEPLPFDARGFARIVGSSVDIGAIELSNDTGPSFELEECALTLQEIDSSGSVILNFTLDDAAPDGTSWIMTRSETLDDFSTATPIFVFDGTSVTTEEPDNSSNLAANVFTITDTNPPNARAFYRLEAEVPSD